MSTSHIIKSQITEYCVFRTNLYQPGAPSPVFFQSLSISEAERRDYLCHHKITVKFNQYIKASSVLKHKSSIMSDNESGSSDRGKSPSPMTSNNDQGRRSK